MQDKRLYNSMIVENYLNLIKLKYPTINPDNLLQEAGIEKWELDPGHWFSQSTMNKFQEVIVAKTGNRDIAREAGWLAGQDRAGNLMRQSALTLLSPANLYDIIGAISSKYTKGTKVKSKKVSPNKHEISVTYKDGVRPKKYQCKSFLGYLEGIYLVFHSKLPKIDHSECIFENGNVCKYTISWQYSLTQLLKPVRNVLFFACFLMLVFMLVFDWPITYFLVTLNLIMLSVVVSVYAEKKELFDTVNKQDFRPDEVLDSHNRFYNSTNLISEISSALSRNTSTTDVLQYLADMFLGLGYQSGLILLLDIDKTKPTFKESIFFKNSSIRLSEDIRENTAELSLLEPIFYKPIIDDFEKLKKYFPEEISSIFNEYDLEPNIYVPIIFERSPLGFIFIYNSGDNQLHLSDLNLLYAIASQSALAFTNISFYNSLLKSEGLKRDFVTVASHEMLTPIQIINLAYQDIVDTLKQSGRLDEELLESIDILEQAVLKLNSIGTTVLNFSKLEEDLMLLPVVTDDLLNEIKKETRHISSSFKHTIEYDIDKNISNISCHKDTFVQLIVNLIENSAKYTPNNGHITVSFQLNSNVLQISVSDNGIGVPEDFHEKIFMKFFQIDGTLTGCGLGLSFSQDVAKNHGGYISIDSPLYPDEKIRKGSRFNVILRADCVN